MAGSKAQAASTKRNQGDDFHRVIGAKGGKTVTNKTKNKGFGSWDREKLRELGKRKK